MPLYCSLLQILNFDSARQSAIEAFRSKFEAGRSIFWFLIIVIACFSCGSQSLDDFREEGNGITQSLIQELKGIQSRKQLLEERPNLIYLFENLVDVIIAAQDFRSKNPDAELSHKNLGFHSDQLRSEMNRIYKNIEGSREIIEKCQERALHRLDAYLKRKNLTGSLKPS